MGPFSYSVLGRVLILDIRHLINSFPDIQYSFIKFSIFISTGQACVEFVDIRH